MAGKAFGIGSFTGSSCNGSGASGVAVTSSTPNSTCIFYDVQTGNISLDCKPGSTDCYTLAGGDYGILSTSTTAENPAFPTGQGWDMATGIGSINIANLINNWQNTAGGGVLYTPTVSLTPTPASYTYGHPTPISFSATVSGPGSFPTGSVTFSGSPTISTIGTDALVASSGCSTGNTCTESAAQSYTPPGTLAGTIYTITANYSSTNENYTSASGTASLTVNPQTPTVTVTAVTIGFGTPTANLAANITYTGSGNAPSAGLKFQVDSGTVVTASCSGSTSPLSCTYNGYNTSALTVGTHTITATSIADGNSICAGVEHRQPDRVAASDDCVYGSESSHHGHAIRSLGDFELCGCDHLFSRQRTRNHPGEHGDADRLRGGHGCAAGVASGKRRLCGRGCTRHQLRCLHRGEHLAWQQQRLALSTFDLTGAAITGTGGFTGGGVGTIAGPLGLAFDGSGNVWVANSNGVSGFNRHGVALTIRQLTRAAVSAIHWQSRSTVPPDMGSQTPTAQ